MIFKKKPPKQIEDRSMTVQEIRDDAMKKILRRQKVKTMLLSLVMIVGLIGGYKALFTKDSKENINAAAESQTFVKTYVSNYYLYPQTEESKGALKNYNLDASWKPDYGKEVLSAQAVGSEVYKVETLSEEATAYYLYVEHETISVDKEDKDAETTEKNTFQIRVDVAEKDGEYLVIRPILMNGIGVNGASEAMRESYEPTFDEGNEPCSDEEKKDISDTLRLFFDTYSKNKEQAQLLTADRSLEDLDPNTRMEFSAIQSASKDDSFFYIKAEVNMYIADTIEQKLNIYFKIDIEKNKIQQMEVY